MLWNILTVWVGLRGQPGLFDAPKKEGMCSLILDLLGAQCKQTLFFLLGCLKCCRASFSPCLHIAFRTFLHHHMSVQFGHIHSRHYEKLFEMKHNAASFTERVIRCNSAGCSRHYLLARCCWSFFSLVIWPVCVLGGGTDYSKGQWNDGKMLLVSLVWPWLWCYEISLLKWEVFPFIDPFCYSSCETQSWCIQVNADTFQSQRRRL